MDEEFQRRYRTIQLIETCCRCFVLFALDFILNGLFASLVIKNPNLVTQPSAFEVLFAYERSNITELWSNLSWSNYCLYSSIYFFCIFVCIVLFLITTSQLLTVIQWGAPLFLLVSSLVWISADERNENIQEEIPFYYLTSTTLLQKWTFIYRFTFRLVYGIYISYLYNESRREIFPILPSFLLKLPFFTPLISLFQFSRPFPLLKNFSLTNFHIPVLLAEMWLGSLNLKNVYFVTISTYRRCKQTINDFGLQAFLVQHWTRLQAPYLLRTFWLCRFCFHLLFVLFSYILQDDMQIFNNNNSNKVVVGSNESLMMMENETNLTFVNNNLTFFDDFGRAARYLTIRSCETFVSVLGTTGIVSSVGHFVGNLFEMFLQDVHDEDRNAGALTGVLFLILCLQTNITGLSADKRVAKLCRNLWLLSMALLHFVHHTLNGLLMRLTTMGNFRPGRHARALLVSAFLLTAPFMFLLYAWPLDKDMFNPWILSVAIFAIELVVKMVVSLCIYILNILDAKVFGYNPKVDEIVYIVRSLGAVLEFLFGILLFFDGLWILFFEQSGLLRAFMICVHAYCNIYLQAVEGWSKLQRRRLAANKLSSLANATEEQVRLYNDVCCICYQEASAGNTKITQCGHYFHAYCLQKWLYMQDKCPLCHKNVCGDSEPVVVNS